MLSFAGCSDDDDANPAPGAGQTPIDPFTGDCTTAKWSHVSDACWSCVCGACAASLNGCNEGCVAAMECSIAKKTLVNNFNDIQCEINATTRECLQNAPEGAAAGVLAFDTCLITATKPSGFRVCEDVCQIPYPGDVCDRYPAM